MRSDSSTRDPGRPDAGGVFYVVQLLPDELPRRLKVGWTTNMGVRLAQYRCPCPDAVTLWTWPCDLWEEKAILKGIAAEGWRRVGRECFDVDDLARLKSVVEAWLQATPQAPATRGHGGRRHSWRGGTVRQRESGRWLGQMSLGYREDGSRRRVALSGATREEVVRRMQEVIASYVAQVRLDQEDRFRRSATG